MSTIWFGWTSDPKTTDWLKSRSSGARAFFLYIVGYFVNIIRLLAHQDIYGRILACVQITHNALKGYGLLVCHINIVSAHYKLKNQLSSAFYDNNE